MLCQGEHAPKFAHGDGLTAEEKTELVRRAQDVVNRVQLRELGQLINVLKEDILTDSQKHYFIIIDGLDEEWAENTIRYRLIKALVEAIRKFLSVRTVKIIICLRTDLLYKVLAETKSVGVQEEKYESLFLRLEWSPDNLKNILNKRVNFLFKRKYTGSNADINDILPSNQMDNTNRH